MNLERWVVGGVLVLCGLTVGVVAARRVPGSLPPDSPPAVLRHPMLCGVSFDPQPHLRFVAGEAQGEAHAVSRRLPILALSAAGPSVQRVVTMRLDVASDTVDLRAHRAGSGASRGAYLVAFDREGRVLDIDAGRVGREPVTMQVTAESPSIARVQYVVPDGSGATSDRISEIDVGAGSADCD